MTLFADIERPLTAADLAEEIPSADTKAPVVKNISERHRRLARLLAEGYSPGDAASATGYGLPRVSILQKDPSFAALVAFYRGQVEEKFMSVAEGLADMTGIAVDEIRTRLEEAPEQFDLDQLLSIVKVGADRTGHGPAGPAGGGMNVTFNIGARLDAATKRQRVIEGQAKEIENE